jgi:DNA (cytosine-5)-methyltransferase 1
MRTIDLFAGCGGLSLGFQNAGCDIIAAYDNWQAVVEVYRKNFSHPIYQIDLSELTEYDHFKTLEPDLIIGGPPCQDFSSAGKRDESQGRADLTLTFAEIVAEVRPRWFVMENVELIQKSQNLKMAKSLLRGFGYGFSEAILNANLCGVPQNRKRYFLIGEIGGTDDTLLPYFEKNMAKKPMTVFDYLGDSLGIQYYYRHPRSYARRAVFSINEPSPTIRGVNRPIPATYKSHPGDAAPVTPDLRPLTTLERSSIQTFPQSFRFEGSKTDLEQMIGNSVPVKLADFVANCLLEYIHDKENGLYHPSAQALQLNLL